MSNIKSETGIPLTDNSSDKQTTMNPTTTTLISTAEMHDIISSIESNQASIIHHNPNVSTVYHLPTKNLVVKKIFDPSLVLNETNTLQSLSHINPESLVSRGGFVPDTLGSFEKGLVFQKYEPLNVNGAKNVLHWTRTFLQALSNLHEAGYAHLDLHPKNLLCHGDQIVIIDYGLSQSLQTDLYEGCGGGGTLGYIAPEIYDSCLRIKESTYVSTHEDGLTCRFCPLSSVDEDRMSPAASLRSFATDTDDEQQNNQTRSATWNSQHPLAKADVYSAAIIIGQWLQPFFPVEIGLHYLGSKLLRYPTTSYICRKLTDWMKQVPYHSMVPAADLLVHMLQTNPFNRASLSELLSSHSFFSLTENAFLQSGSSSVSTSCPNSYRDRSKHGSFGGYPSLSTSPVSPCPISMYASSSSCHSSSVTANSAVNNESSQSIEYVPPPWIQQFSKSRQTSYEFIRER